MNLEIIVNTNASNSQSYFEKVIVDLTKIQMHELVYAGGGNGTDNLG